MRAVICDAWGPIDSLRIGDLPPPSHGSKDVLINVKAVAVNYADAIMVGGTYQTKPAFPFAPGLECAGTVAAAGAEVTGFKPGDRVMALLAHGGFAEQAVAPAGEVWHMAPDMDFATAGGFPVAYISSHVAIRWQGRLEESETLLVLGAAGGVGLTAVEIGKAIGATVIAAASSDERLAVAKEHGADHLVNYKAGPLKDQVMEVTGGRGADVCFDPVGGDLFDPALSSLDWGGRYLLVGFVGGIPQIPANRLLVKHRSAMGSSLRFFRAKRPDLLRRSVTELLTWYGAGKLKPLVQKIHPLDDAVAALASLTQRQAFGKVILKVSD